MKPRLLPGVLWLNRKGWMTFGRLVVLGAILGNLPFVVIVIGIISVQLVSGTPVPEIGRNWYGVSGFLVRMAMGVVAGAASAAAFWLVAVCGTTGESGRSSLPLNAP